MEHPADDGKADDADADADFVFLPIDENGHVWICSPEGRDVWCKNLGPYEAVATRMADWLGEQDFGE